jgi:NADPH-dependent 2,4-dienoyl-CoA reductase/sulfur reductase-like enzyme
MSASHIVVAGASLGGLRIVEALRRLGNDARITLIGDESETPDDRPPLSKDLLFGKVDAVGVRLTTHESLAALDIELRLGERAIRLDPVARRLVLDESSLVGYDDLVIATGSSLR